MGKYDKKPIWPKFIILIGLIAFILPLIPNIKNIKKTKDYIKTTAEIIDIYERKNESDNYSYNIKITYKYIVNNEEYIDSYSYNNVKTLKENDKIKIKYNPNNPSESYYIRLLNFNVFQIVGLFFIFIPTMMLCRYQLSKDIFLFIFGSNIILYMIISGIYLTGAGILFLIIFGLLTFASIMDFRTIVKNKPNFNIIEEINNILKNNKNIKQRIKQKEYEQELKNPQIKIDKQTKKKKKIKNLLIGILLFLSLPISLTYYINTGYTNETIYTITCIITSIITLIGFSIIGFTLMGFEPENSTIYIGGKLISKNTLKNAKNMSFLQILIEFNILETLLKIFAVIFFVFSIYFLIEDPLNLLYNINNVGRVQTIGILFIIIIYHILITIIHKTILTKRNIIKWILIYSLIILFIFFITKTDNNHISPETFKSILLNENYEIINSSDMNFKTKKEIIAVNENIKIIYYEFENISNARNSYEKIEKYYDNLYQWNQSSTHNSFITKECIDINKFWCLSKINNTIIYGETTYDNKEILIEIFEKLGYKD